MPSRFTKWLAIALLLIALLCGGAIWLWKANEWGFRSALPSTATDISEWYWSDDFTGDYSYQLKAKITDVEFSEYIKLYRLTLRSAAGGDPDESIWLSWQSVSHDPTPWWDPSESLDQTYVNQSGDTWTYAKYENGYLYLKSISH